MPAKKIIDAVASTFSVIGSSIATAVAGPIPGSTPTAVPMLQPNSAHSRLTGVAAVAKPCIRLFRMSIASDPSGPGQPRQVDRQRLGEHPVHRRRDRDAERRALQQRRRVQAQPALRMFQPAFGEQETQRAAQDEADRRDQPGVEQDAGAHPDERDPVGRSVVGAFDVQRAKAPGRRFPGEQRAADHEREPDDPRQEVRADAAVAGLGRDLRRAGGDRRAEHKRADTDQALAQVHQIIPALTITARRLAKSSSTNLPNASPVSSAGVQPFLSTASAQALVLVALTIPSISAVRCAGVMSGAPYTPRQLLITTSMPSSFSVGASTPLSRLSEVTAIGRILPLLMYSPNSVSALPPTVTLLPRIAATASPPPRKAT